ncbi:glycosyltransferase family 4 protein [Ohtaekwangia sp.]|uniref:glycosyltransferase family 4 protein n=1 Tax=Ohtaekwangia sp. TaxID=2066019 RepID=UPI002FDDA39E
MKILQIIQKPELRGAEIFACQLSEELIKLGHQVDVVYLFEHKNFDLSFSLSYIALGAVQEKRFFDFKAYRRLRDIIKQGKYDVVQANASDTLKYAVISKVLYGWKAPLIFRNASKMGDFMKNGLHRSLNRFFLKKCSYFISVCENCRQDLIALYKGASDRSCTITIGTYPFEEIPSLPLNSKPSEPVFINVSSFVPEKNHEFLLRLFSGYFTNYKQGYLWLVGDGKLRNKLEQLVSELGIGERVRFWGYRKDVISIIKSSDIMLMPSRVEGLPGVILEALACGVPVIASAVGGIPEIIFNNENGYCVEKEDESVYIKHLNTLVENDALRKRLAQAGKDLIYREYLMPHIAKRFAEQYKIIVG